ncbi:MAG: 2-isopropylmalate synthase [Lachnospiraceae bacterium]|nr:2-isopropylmalate synthase [Lachnospiraceae bacterium]
MNYKHYRKNPVLSFPERTWPSKEIEKAPIWCSVDLRDGNQALIDPMDVDQKMEFFDLILDLGIKEIEIGFPAASQIEFDFLRRLVKENKIPSDVKVQILSQCRKELIDKSFEAIEGIDNVIFHIYNSTSTLQREVVFGMSREEIIQIAIDGTRMVKEGMKNFKGNIQLEYSPESFSGTEVDFALDICTAVQEEWGDATPGVPIIFNLPNTVEMNTPNVYADQIEWMSTHFKRREDIILSVHPHNDRGTGVAGTELALLAGADRVEGTLLGNGERTGNVDMLTVAYNMFSQGVDPKLHIEDIKRIVEVYERCTGMNLDPRHPYAGSLVFTAFSGSHQDAINKGTNAMKAKAEAGEEDIWRVPYLPIDPADIGRKYEPVVRINSQSGKGGVAYVMDSVFGYKLPKKMQREFADVIQYMSEQQGGEIKPEQIMKAFRKEYIGLTDPFTLIFVDVDDNMRNDETEVVVDFSYQGEVFKSEASGNGPIDAVKLAIRQCVPEVDFKVLDYSEHALSTGSHAKAAAYIEMQDRRNGNIVYGVGISSNITRASIRGMFSALNRLHKKAKDYV